MYEFNPKRKSGVAPIWFILVSLIAFLAGANLMFLLFPQEEPAVSVTTTPTPLIIKTPATTFNTSPEASPSVSATATASQSVVVN